MWLIEKCQYMPTYISARFFFKKAVCRSRSQTGETPQKESGPTGKTSQEGSTQKPRARSQAIMGKGPIKGGNKRKVLQGVYYVQEVTKGETILAPKPKAVLVSYSRWGADLLRLSRWRGKGNT